MKYIITESQIRYIIKKLFKKDFSNKIQRILGWDDLSPSFKRVFGEERMFNLYLRDFGPMYIILNEGKEYLVQKRDGKWIIVDDRDRPFSEYKFMHKLGIEPLGISLDEFIDAYMDEIFV